MESFDYECQCEGKHIRARAGVIHTPHGDIKTPAFVPVGTQATVKSLTPEELSDLGVSLFFVNTYHMYLRPGIEVVKKFGGLHGFMGWDGPIITDSGGFQVFSLGRGKIYARRDENFLDPLLSGNHTFSAFIQNHGILSKPVLELGKQSTKILSPPASNVLVTISDDGVMFQSHWDGSKHTFTPERSMQYQWDLGSDIHIAFDECTTYPTTHEYAKKAMERTHRWAVRSLRENKKIKIKNQKLGKPDQALYGVVQGSVYEDLRKKSAEYISSMDFDGIAIGGVSVGESKGEMKEVLDWVTPLFPDNKPRHLLGVGEIDDIFTLVEHGIDTFDCVQPTRLARMGKVYVMPNTRHRKSHEKRIYEVDITKKEFGGDIGPIDRECRCYTCQHFSRGYVHHLFRVRELLGYRLATIHNISFVNKLMSDIRLAIRDNSLVALKKTWRIQ